MSNHSNHTHFKLHSVTSTSALIIIIYVQLVYAVGGKLEKIRAIQEEIDHVKGVMIENIGTQYTLFFYTITTYNILSQIMS